MRFLSQAATCTSETPGKVYFKGTITNRNTDASWISYEKSTPCDVLSRYDYWSQPSKTVVGSDGASIILSSGVKGKATAVRMNWRNFPCEHDSCGVYAAAENLPLHPFYAALE